MRAITPPRPHLPHSTPPATWAHLAQRRDRDARVVRRQHEQVAQQQRPSAQVSAQLAGRACACAHACARVCACIEGRAQ
eukprot:352623-Chlamydomonas_euryale.AAC.2